MIRFACRNCKQMLEAADDQAGSAVQCPHCGILNDAPSFSDLEQLAEDGTFKMSDAAPPAPHTLSDLMHVYSRYDQQGDQIDHRGPVVDENEAYEIAEEPDASRKPKYDPDTGELIRPLETSQNSTAVVPVDQAAIPMARPALTYATGASARGAGLGYVLIDLFRPMNMLVMTFIGGAHIFLGFLMYLAALVHFLFAVPMLICMLALLLSHWGNVVDEIGREGRTELPRPFRDMRWGEDVWHPLYALMLALLICYLPGRLVLMINRHNHWIIGISIGLEVIATFFFPAVFLTTSNSGSLVNLHPKRLLGVIWACGAGYAIAVLAWTLAIVPYFWPVMVTATVWYAPLISWMPWWGLAPQFVAPAGILGVFLMHWFCWTLGLLEGTHHIDFPWVHQYHVRTSRNERPLPVPKPAVPRGPHGSPDRARELNRRPLRRNVDGV